jgi:YesN/AraC family two-component response regulator
LPRILVIEDEPLVRVAIKKRLEIEGFEVTTADDGQKGVKSFRDHPADLVITDIIMPEKEGIECIKELTRDFPGIKIIAISGGGRIGPFDYLDLAEKFGASRTFKKPFEWPDMIRAIHELLGPPLDQKETKEQSR